MAQDSKNLSQKYAELLKESNTAYAPNVDPTESDIRLQQQLMKSKKKETAAESERLKAEWYGEKTGERKTGYLKGVLRTIGAPLSAVAGTAEWALGKGSEDELFANIAANVKEGGTFGDIVRSYGAPNLVALPLGFALDVALDPVSWATAGSSAIVPRLGIGAVKGAKAGTGALKGLGIAAKSGALTKLEGAGRMVPGLAKRAFETASTGAIPSKYRKIAEMAYKSRGEFDTMVGKTAEDVLNAGVKAPKIVDKISSKLSGHPFGDEAVKAFRYSSDDWIEMSMAKDLERKGVTEAEKAILMSDESGIDHLLSATGTRTIKKEVADAATLIENPQISRAENSFEVAARLRSESIKDAGLKFNIEAEVKKIMAKTGVSEAEAFVQATKKGQKLENLRDQYYSGLKIWDKQVEKVIDSDYGQKFLENYAIFMGLFKTAKIGGNVLTAGTNAIFGNLTMTAMAGLDVMNPGLVNSMKNAVKLVGSSKIEALRPLMDNPRWREAIETYPDTFQAIYGLNPGLLLRGESFIDDVAQKMAKEGKSLDGFNDIKELYRKTVRDATDKSLYSKAYDAQMGKSRSATSALLEEGRPTTFITDEIFRGPFGEFVNKISQSDAPFAKAFHWYLTKPSEAYNKFDQTFRLGLAMHLTENGITERELLRLSRFVKMGAEDVSRIPNRDLFKLNPTAAMKASSEVYMNYMAMPAAVQIMRSLPILGSPFISFAYGMSAKTFDTAMYNPNVFNKVQFLLHEISGNQSPLEKKSLQKPYYKWYTQPGMVKLSMLPFFQDNPIYLNMENMIPYYTMNIFQPSERTYEEKLGGTVSAIVDKSPFLKTPEGQVMFDYFIQPLILQEQQIRGAFDQPLWPESAKLPEKIGRGALSAAESVVPSSVGFAGLFTPSSAAPFVPSYRMRQLSYAKEGKGSTGIQTKEPALEKTMRVLAAMAGYPTYQMKLQYSQ